MSLQSTANRASRIAYARAAHDLTTLDQFVNEGLSSNRTTDRLLEDIKDPDDIGCQMADNDHDGMG